MFNNCTFISRFHDVIRCCTNEDKRSTTSSSNSTCNSCESPPSTIQIEKPEMIPKFPKTILTNTLLGGSGSDEFVRANVNNERSPPSNRHRMPRLEKQMEKSEPILEAPNITLANVPVRRSNKNEVVEINDNNKENPFLKRRRMPRLEKQMEKSRQILQTSKIISTSIPLDEFDSNEFVKTNVNNQSNLHSKRRRMPRLEKRMEKSEQILQSQKITLANVPGRGFNKKEGVEINDNKCSQSSKKRRRPRKKKKNLSKKGKENIELCKEHKQLLYKEKYRCYGYYRCSCKKYWESANSWVGYMQRCKSCENEVYAYCQHPLEGSGNRNDQHKPHPITLCGKCRELRRACYSA